MVVWWLFAAERREEHRSQTSSGSVVRWISGWLEVSQLCTRGSEGRVSEQEKQRGGKKRF